MLLAGTLVFALFVNMEERKKERKRSSGGASNFDISFALGQPAAFAHHMQASVQGAK